MIVLLGFLLAIAVLTGAACGIAALFKIHTTGQLISAMRYRLSRLEDSLAHLEKTQTQPEPTQATPETPLPDETKEEEPPLTDSCAKSPKEILAEISEAQPPASPPPLPVLDEKKDTARGIGPALEFHVGTRWLLWVGVVMLLVGMALALKYAYDKNYFHISPTGRIIIAALFGLALLVQGERFRRKSWTILFQGLTGCGIAIFYLCIYFSFDVYKLTGPGLAMTLAVCVTLFAIFMAVFHNALPIAVLALMGGYLSPFFLSTGENLPYQLFTYITILNLVALVAAYFRRWHSLNLFCFIATTMIYQAWFAKFYNAGQMTPAMVYATIFYVIFLVTPNLHGLFRGKVESVGNLTLVVVNTLVAFLTYHRILFSANRDALTLVVLAQAVAVLFFYRVWKARMKEDTTMSTCHLLISIALLTLAIPIQFKFYALAIAWAVEGALLAWIGRRFENSLCKACAIIALLLSVAGLVDQLPLHSGVFVPVLNAPFGSWMFVIIASVTAGVFFHRGSEKDIAPDRIQAAIAFLTALVLTCVLLTLEVFAYWRIIRGGHWPYLEANSLVVLWTLIPLALTLATCKYKSHAISIVTCAAYLVGICFLGYSGLNYASNSTLLALNWAFLCRAGFIAAMWLSMRMLGAIQPSHVYDAMELAGHVLALFLSVFELASWSNHAPLISEEMAMGMVSGAWAIQACVLIWYGLRTQRSMRRMAGFFFFGITVCKVLIVDTATLEPIHRIISWLATGILLITAGFFYQKYSVVFLGEEEKEADQPITSDSGPAVK